MHSTHFIYGYLAPNIRKRAAATKRATLLDYQQGIFRMHHTTDVIARTTIFIKAGTINS